MSGFSYSEAFYFAFAGFEKAGKRQFADERGIEEAHRLVEGDLAVEAVASCRVDLMDGRSVIFCGLSFPAERPKSRRTKRGSEFHPRGELRLHLEGDDERGRLRVGFEVFAALGL